MTKDEASERVEKLVDDWLDNSEPGVANAYVTLRQAITALVLTTDAEAKEEAAKVAENSRPIALHVATAIRAQKHGEKE